MRRIWFWFKLISKLVTHLKLSLNISSFEYSRSEVIHFSFLQLKKMYRLKREILLIKNSRIFDAVFEEIHVFEVTVSPYWLQGKRAICSCRSLKKKERKEQFTLFAHKEQFALLKRVKERFALFCQKTLDLHEKSKSKFATLGKGLLLYNYGVWHNAAHTLWIKLCTLPCDL